MLDLKTLPYVYKITHKTTGQFYIGSRTTKYAKHHSLDLGINYFTSSKYIKELGFENFNIDWVEEFENPETAYKFEQLIIFESIDINLCLNKVCHFNKQKFSMTGKQAWNKNIPMSDQQKEKLKGIKRSDKTKQILRDLQLGKKASLLTKNKISKSNTGKIVSEKTCKLISTQKIAFYSIQENRNKHSQYCKDIPKSEQGRLNIKAAAQNRPPRTKESILKGLKTRESKNYKFQSGSKGIYVTPFGNFDSVHKSSYNYYCTIPDKIISIHNVKKNKLLNKSVIGMTFRELGFYLIDINDTIKVKELYDTIGLIHPPEPNHPLLLELNDYLSHEKFQN